MKRFFILTAIILLSFSAAGEGLHYTDTLKTAKKQAQLTQALELAPSTFVYADYQTDGKSYASITGLRFNDSFRNILKTDYASDDPAFRKRLKKLTNMLRPLNIVCTFTVRYKQVPEGIAISYDLTDIRIWGRKAKTKELEIYEKP